MIVYLDKYLGIMYEIHKFMLLYLSWFVFILEL